MWTHTDVEDGVVTSPSIVSLLCVLRKVLLLNPRLTDGSGICLSTLPSVLGLPLWTFYIDAGDPNAHPDACTPPHPSLAKPSPLPCSRF